jgi:hypothetical protein
MAAAPPGYHEQFLGHSRIILGFPLDAIQGLPRSLDFDNFRVTADGMSAKLSYNAQFGVVHAEELSRNGERVVGVALPTWHMEHLVIAFVQPPRNLTRLVISNVAEQRHGTRDFLQNHYSDEQSHLVQAGAPEFQDLVRQRGTLGYFAGQIPGLQSIYVIVRVNDPKLVFNYVPTVLVQQAPPVQQQSSYPPTQQQQEREGGCCSCCIIQ